METFVVHPTAYISAPSPSSNARQDDGVSTTSATRGIRD